MDFARLTLAVDTKPLDQAEKALDDLAATGAKTAAKIDGALDRMDDSLEDVAGSAQHAAKGMNVYERAVRDASTRIPAANDNIAGMGSTSRLASHHVQNLGFQVQDLAVQLASGANPLTAFIQQGSQISGIMMQSGLSVRQFAGEILTMTARATAAVALNPYFLALAAATGAVYVAFKDFSNEVAKTGELERYAAGLGLTAKEMKELGPVSITAMDAVKGVWKTIKDGLNLDSVFTFLSDAFTSTFRFIGEAAVGVMAGVYGVFVGTYRGIVATWDMLPAAFGDLVTQAGNSTIRGLNGLIASSIGLINGMIGVVNPILDQLGIDTFNKLTTFNIPEMQNRYSGAANRASAAFTGEIVKATGEARGAMEGVGNTISNNIVQAAKDRLAASAAGIIDERSEKALKDKAAKTGTETGDALAEYINKQTGKVTTALTVSLALDKDPFGGAIGELEKRVTDFAEAQRRAAEEQRAAMMANLNTFRDVASEAGQLIGGALGQGVQRLADLLARDFPEFSAFLGDTFRDIGRSIDRVLSGLGTSLGKLGQSFGVGSAIGNLVGGSSVGGGIGGALGGAVGGKLLSSLGSFAGPIGTIAGGLLGSLLGGLFKKNPFADVRLSGTGSGTLFNQRGGEESASAGLALGDAFSREIGLIAQALGATVKGNANFGAIGFSGDQFYFNPTGGDFKAAGNMRFGTAEQAVAAAIRNAVNQGAFEGLTESSKTILASLQEVNADAVVRAVEQLNAARGTLVEAYNREASALTATLDRIRGFTAGLTAFRANLAEQLMTAEEIYQAARGRFEEISRAAIAGNEAAIGDLVGVSQRYLDAAKGFLTPEEYSREIENVMRAVDLAIAQTKTMEQYAQGQLDALNKSVEGLLKVDESVVSVRQAVDRLNGVMGGFAARASAPVVNPLYTQADFYMGGGGGGFFSDGMEPPRFATGGMHSGGLAIVGEQGPELVNMGPARVWNATETASMLGGRMADEATQAELVKQNEYLRELVKLNAKQERTLREIELQGETA
jgi:hypothetical protein